MVVHHIQSDVEFGAALQSAGSSLVVCDFYADWCGPCRMIAPLFEQLSAKYAAATFLKVNVDTCRMTCMQYQVRAMPTFVALRNGAELARIQGANPGALEQLVASNVGPDKANASNNALKASAQERAWLDQFLQYAEKVKAYEDAISQTMALSLIPDDLLDKATIDGKVNHYELARLLMEWFHGSFFSWFKADCESCGTRLTNCSHPPPTVEEQQHGATRVELYHCTTCNKELRFPRYNNPEKLLATRQGRCGEWANCFALCCRAVGLETRFVVDNADHVWTEIWSEELDRWVHCDPCENVIDTPLMYEKGWGKKYAYVFAFAVDHMQDVTWRYSQKRKTLLKRRRMCREDVLRNFVKKLNLRLSKNASEEQRTILTLRCMKEVIEFLTPKFQLRDGSEAQNYGRKSGDEQWRKQRGELGSAGSAHETIVIRPTSEELEQKFVMIEYDCVSDKYKRCGKDVEGGFATLAHTAKNIFRKVESDWKMAYLCRRPGAVNGELSWKIEIPPEYVERVSLAAVKLGRLDTFGSGKVSATICCGDVCGRIPEDTGVYIIHGPGSNVPYIEVNVSFYGGDGENAWQHAQLFRTKLDEPEGTMRLRIEFK